MSLRDKTISAVGWSAIDNVSYISVSFIVGIVLARLLSPDDFGLIGVITVFTAVCNTLINSGFASALVRKKDVTQDDYNTAFTINLLISIFLYIIIFIFSPYIAIFFSRNELSLLIKVSSLELVIGALAITQKACLTKNINFKSQAKVTLISTLASGVICITLAWGGAGVWALIFQILTKTSIQTILLWFVNKWSPALRITKESFYNLFEYGWKVMLNDCLHSIWSESFQLVIGKCYSTASLGQYTRSKQFSFIFSSNLTNVVQRVSFPVLSSIQEDKDRMVRAYRRIIRTTMFATAISMLFLSSISEPLVYCLIGPQWHEASVYLPLLCLSASTYPLQAMNKNMLQVQGRSDILLSLGLIEKIICTVPLIFGVFVGIIPMLIANLISWIIMFFFNSYYSGRLIGYSTMKQLSDVVPSYAIGLIIALPLFYFKFLPFSYWVILPLQLLFCLSMLFIICEHYKIYEYIELKNLGIKYMKNIAMKT